jgi:outer membrane protein
MSKFPSPHRSGDTPIFGGTRLLAAAVGLAIACCGISGCATVRRAREAQDAAQVPPGERTVTAAELNLSSNSLLTLDAALQIALDYHPSVTQARQNLIAAAAQVQQARAAYLPAVDASAGYRRATANSQGANGSNHSRDLYSGALDLNLLLYDFGKSPAIVRQAYARQLAAEETLRATRNNVIFVVRTTFFNLSKAQELVQVADQAVHQFQAHLDQVRAFAEVGRRTRYDVTKAEVDLGNAQLALISANNGVANARAALHRSLGLAEEPGYRIGAPPPPEDIARPIDELMAMARQHHPELWALKAQERVASAVVDEQIAALYPALNLQGQYGVSGSQLPLVWNWSAALQSAVQLFSGWRNTAAIDDAVAQLRAARSRVADREQLIYVDLSTALSQLSSARQSLDLTALIVRQAQESVDLIKERYRLGQASAVDVTDAEVALTRARADGVQARFDYHTAIAQIKHAIGEA